MDAQWIARSCAPAKGCIDFELPDYPAKPSFGLLGGQRRSRLEADLVQQFFKRYEPISEPLLNSKAYAGDVWAAEDPTIRSAESVNPKIALPLVQSAEPFMLDLRRKHGG